MSGKYFIPVLLLALVIITFFPGCKLLKGTSGSSTKVKTPKRFYYDFSKKKLLEKEDASEEMYRRIAYRSGKDIQIEVFNYNPLKVEIIVEDSSSEKFLGDTGKLAQYVVLPKMTPLTEGEQKKEEVENKTGKTPKDPFGFFSLQEIIRVEPKKTDCDLLKGYMYSITLQKEKIDSLMLFYQSFLARIEVIKDDYEDIKASDIITSAEISDKVRDNFLLGLNSILPSSDQVAATPLQVSSRQLSELEQKYYKAIIDEETDLLRLKREAEGLKGEGCKEYYIDLYKKFNNAVTELTDKMKDFKTAHNEKILPSFSKTLLIYNQLKRYMIAIPHYITKAVAVTKDEHTITIYKKDIGKDNRVIYDHINIEPTRGFKVDVAGGFFFSCLKDENFTKKTKDSIYTKKYLLDGVMRDTTVQESFTAIFEKEQSNISFGGMLFLHAHTQNACWINYGAYLGFGALFNDQTRWAGAFGGSLLFGKDQRFSVNPGAIIAQVERLSPPYKTDTWYRETIDNIVTYKAWKVKFVLGFSWNFR